MGKEKLTLSVDKEVVEKAKKLGINISEITETILKSFTFSAEVGKGNLYDGYKFLFDAMVPILRETGVGVPVADETVRDKDGNVSYSSSIFLEPDGSFYSDIYEATFKDIRKIDIRDMFTPKEILSKLIDQLIKNKEMRTERMKELQMAKRIIDAIAETVVPKRPKSAGEERGKNVK